MVVRSLILRYGSSHTRMLAIGRRCMSSTRYTRYNGSDHDNENHFDRDFDRTPSSVEQARRARTFPAFITNGQPWLHLLLEHITVGGKFFKTLGVMSNDHYLEKLFQTLADSTEEQKEYLIKTLILDLKDLESEGLPSNRTESTVRNIIAPFKSFDKLKEQANLNPALEKVFCSSDIFPYMVESRVDYISRFCSMVDTDAVDRLCEAYFQHYENIGEIFLKRLDIDEQLPHLLSKFTYNGSKVSRDKVLEYCLDNEEVLFDKTARGIRFFLFKVCLHVHEVEPDNEYFIKLYDKILLNESAVSSQVVAKILETDSSLKELTSKRISNTLNDIFVNENAFPYGIYSYFEVVDNTTDLETCLNIIFDILDKEDSFLIRKRTVRAFDKIMNNSYYSQISNETKNKLLLSLEENIDIFFINAKTHETFNEMIKKYSSIDNNLMKSINKGIIKYVKNNIGDRKTIFALFAFKDMLISATNNNNISYNTDLIKLILSEYQLFHNNTDRIGVNIILTAFKDEYVDNTSKIDIIDYLNQNINLLSDIIDSSSPSGIRFITKLTEASEKHLQSHEDELRFFQAVKDLFENFIIKMEDNNSEDFNHMVLNIFKRTISSYPREINDEYSSLFTKDMLERNPFIEKFIWVLKSNCSFDEASKLMENFNLK